MSLFGGDSSVPPTDSEYDSELDNPPSINLSPPKLSLDHLQSASDHHIPAFEDLAQYSTGSDADSEASNDNEPGRLNRFEGPPQTWKGYTAADRQIAESLQQLEDTDLAAHLYNTHALKRRARQPVTDTTELYNWENKDAWLKQGKDLQYTDVAGQLQTALVPSKDWTAWPLPPASLYSLSNGFRRAAVAPEKDEWVIGGSGPRDPGTELKEEMLGLFLRVAKENWNKKEWQNEERESTRKRAQSRARSQSVRSDAEMRIASEDVFGQGEGDVAVEGGVKRGRKPQIEMDFEPTILADDQKAQRILQPTIASILSKMDDVALALQRTRLNHFGRSGIGEGSSQSEFTTDAETTERESRSRSRSRTKNVLRSKSATRQSSRPSSSRASRAPKSAKKPSNAQIEPQDSDSASDYGAQFVERDGQDSDVSREPERRRKRSRSESTMDGDDQSNTRDWSRTGLMDWSEILSVAAVKGWNQQALARTAHRCSTLFGEGMSFMPFHADNALRAPAEHVHHTPTIITAPPESIVGRSRSKKRPYFQPGAVRCPHTDCFGHHKDFAMSYRVIEHCMRIHGYDPRSNDSENEERTHGGVHIDGFLQPITAKQGWLGHGRSKAGGKKRRTEEAEPASLADAVARIEDRET